MYRLFEAAYLQPPRSTLRFRAQTSKRQVPLALPVLAKNIFCQGIPFNSRYLFPGIGGAYHPSALPISNYLNMMEQTVASNNGAGIFGSLGQLSLGEYFGKCHL